MSNDRERLIELLSYFADGYLAENRHIAFDTKVCDIADHLLANGVGVMPCKVGDSVYCIENRERIVKTYTVYCMRFEWFTSCTEVILTAREHDKLNTRDYREFFSCHIGKTVFLTKEKAEKALAERIGK